MKRNKFCKNEKADSDDPGLSVYLSYKKATKEVNGF